jgi:hypothetical protein
VRPNETHVSCLERNEVCVEKGLFISVDSLHTKKVFILNLKMHFCVDITRSLKVSDDARQDRRRGTARHVAVCSVSVGRSSVLFLSTDLKCFKTSCLRHPV